MPQKTKQVNKKRDEVFSTRFAGRVLREYFEEFKRLCSLYPFKGNGFTQESIAGTIFTNEDGEALSTARHLLNRLVNEDDRRPSLDQGKVEAIIDQLTIELDKQVESANRSTFSPSDGLSVNEIRSRIHARLGVEGDLESEHFQVHARLESARTAEQLGLFDPIAWDSDRPWFDAHRPQARRYALGELESMPSVALGLHDTRRRLQLAMLAVSVAFHCYPGSQEHDRSCMLAERTVALCGVESVFRDVRHDDSERLEASRILLQLNWLRFSPHHESSVNLVGRLTSGHRIPDKQNEQVLLALDEVTRLVRARLQIAPNDSLVRLEAASALSYPVRYFAASSASSAKTAAKKLLREARELEAGDLSRYVAQAEVMTAMSREHWAVACRLAEDMTRRAVEAKRQIDAEAFAALTVQLSVKVGKAGKATEDSVVRQLAKRAVAKPQVAYMNAHVFDVREVVRLLGVRDPFAM